MENQDELRKNVKIWLKTNGYNYAWLAERCFVTEATVRNWMARKTIPAAKVYIIRDLVRQVSMEIPERRAIEVHNETRLTIVLCDEVRQKLEHLAFSRGQTISELLESELARLAEAQA